jgi:hypothetical protein
MTVENIQSGFRKTGIYPLDPSAMDSSMGPTSDTGEVGVDEHLHNFAGEEAPGNIPVVSIEEVLLENPEVPWSNTHYTVQIEDSEGEGPPDSFKSRHSGE